MTLQPSDLYSNLRAECLAHLARELQQRVLGQAGADPVRFLGHIDEVWQSHCDQMILIRCIFLHLDRAYAHTTAGVDTLWAMGLLLFRDNVAGNEHVLGRIVSGLLLQVQLERTGDRVDTSQTKRLIRMLVDLGLYAEHFEGPFIDETKLFYSAEAKRKLDDLEASAYLSYADNRIREERGRIELYADLPTQKPALAAIEHNLLRVTVDEVLRKGLCSMLADNRHEDLARLYRLLKRVDELGTLQQAFEAYTLECGKVIVMSPEKDKYMVDELLNLKQKLDAVVTTSFQASEVFMTSVKSSFETFINKRHNKPAEMIAKFFDAKLRTGYKECTEEGLDVLFDRTLVLFRFINGKDVFEAFYKTYLARRLLLQKSASDDAERSILSKLKQECGGAFTSKLEGMVKDVGLSVDLTASFRETARRQSDSAVDLNVAVLTASNWPTYTPVEITLPPEIVRLQGLFYDFYCAKHGNRKLTWENSLGHCLIEGQFPKGNKDLQMSVYQGAVLLTFNQRATATFKDIQQATKIDQPTLMRVLQSLACAKVRVLAKTPKGREVAVTDRFAVNVKFENKHKRIKINQIQLKETKEEVEKVQEKVFQDRIFAVDAAIVRVMKSRKSLKHNLLLTELFEQLKFPAKPADLKKRIESLIDREYMERDENDATNYLYVA